MEKNTLTQPGYRTRLIDERIKECLATFGAVSLDGPKWCGKTWTALHHSNSAAYFGRQNSPDYALAKTNLNLVLNREAPELLDEWQDFPEIWDEVRYLCDQKNLPGLYILTGSATPPKSQGKIHHSGAGRICQLDMHTMSLYETGDSTGEISLQKLFENSVKEKEVTPPTLEQLARLIIRGGWPAGLSRPVVSSALSEGYIEDILRKDISYDGVKRSPEKMRFLLRSLARNESTVVSNNTLARDTHSKDEAMSKKTISDYLDILSELHLLSNQPAYRENVRSPERIGTSAKRHLADPSLSATLLGLDEARLINDLNTFGFLFEALCEHDLRIYAETLGGAVRHYRNNVSGLEIDAIIELKNGDIGAIEIKLGPNSIEDAAKSLAAFSSELTIKPTFKAIICGLYPAIARREDGIYVFPITALKP